MPLWQSMTLRYGSDNKGLLFIETDNRHVSLTGHIAYAIKWKYCLSAEMRKSAGPGVAVIEVKTQFWPILLTSMRFPVDEEQANALLELIKSRISANTANTSANGAISATID
jgi:hypothetical protein